LVVEPSKTSEHRHREVKVVSLGEHSSGSLSSLAAASPSDPNIEPRTENDIAVIIYTSGTTGLPKGAMISHGNLISNGETLLKAWGWSTEDVLLHTLPVFHVHGLFVGLHLPLLAGTPILFHSSFSTKTVLAALPSATVFMGVPTYYTRLLNDGIDQRSSANMRLFISGSAPLLATTFSTWEQATGKIILERYGMSETGMNISNPLTGERRAGTVGLPLPGVECRIVDEKGLAVASDTPGDLWVKGANVFSGYWNNPDKTAESFTEEGFFITGDIASIDPDGYISIVGRSKDLIISGGLNIYPKELELLLDKFEPVSESAVIGLPHPDFGEAVCAVIVLKPNALPDADEIQNYMRQQVANFKVPKAVFFTDQLPRNSMSKVQKNLLRDQHQDTFIAP
jgi:malonyl-CoA/methylmalonyl-CoA synthetase